MSNEPDPASNWKNFLCQLQSQLELVGPMSGGEKYQSNAPIFIDGGARWRRASTHGFAVGDGDSSPTPLDLLLPADKDYSDLRFVLQAIPANVCKVRLLGFEGGRKDHELINLGECYAFLAERKQPTQMIFDSPSIMLTGGTWTLENLSTFSLVAFEPCQPRLQGKCRYHLDGQRTLGAFSSLALSNESTGPVFLKCDKPLLICNAQRFSAEDTQGLQTW